MGYLLVWKVRWQAVYIHPYHRAVRIKIQEQECVVLQVFLPIGEFPFFGLLCYLLMHVVYQPQQGVIENVLRYYFLVNGKIPALCFLRLLA